MRAQNEELQSINEELRSTAEELETSKEEAQSMSEELRTVNDELKAKVDETARAKGDLENLISSTEIATLFLDRDLHIQRFTPHVRNLFHVLASDVGRPLADLAQKFGGVRLVEDAEAVLERLDVREREVESEDGRWHLVHTRPYRTVKDRIDGVVITFVDITGRKTDEEALRASESRYRMLFESIDEGFCVLDLIEDDAGTPVSYRFVETNPAFEKQSGLVGVEGKTIHDAVPSIEKHWIETYGRVAQTGERARFIEESSAMGRWFEIEAFRIGAPERRRIAVLFTDVTQRIRDEREIQRFTETLETRVTKRTNQVRALSARLTRAEEEERQRIALVLHDDLQQQLAALGITLDMLWSAPASGEQQSLRDRATVILGSASDLTRTLASELSPRSLANEDLAVTLHWLAERKREQYQLDVTVAVDGPCMVPDETVRALLYNVVRELLFNVVKHAGTSRSTLRAHRDGGTIVVVVEDDGDGFDEDRLDMDAPAAPEDGLGLFSARERIEMAGGSLSVDSRPQRGTRVVLSVPAGGPLAPEA